MKVRWSSSCAGGCGRWLVVGTHAVRAHRGYWCSGCWLTHAASCLRHALVDTPVQHRDESVQPEQAALW